MRDCKNKVTLMTPCYNGEKFLSRWARCILNQDYGNIEIIFVNDGSTDRSEEIVFRFRENFIKKGYGFIYLKKENGGAASAIDFGLKHVTGDYLMLYDVDDIIMRNAVSEKARYLDEHPDYGMVRNNGYYVKNKNLGQNSYLFITKRKEKKNEYIFDDIVFGRTNNWTASFMVRCKALWKCLGGRSIYVSPWGQNMQLMLPVAYFYKTGFIDIPLMRYVEHGNSVSRPGGFEKESALLDGYKENRIEIIRDIYMKEEEKRQYFIDLEKMYAHIKLECAVRYHKKEKVSFFYSEIKSLNDLKLSDFMYYFFGRRKITVQLLVKVYAVKKMLWCVYHKIEGRIFRHDAIY